MKVGAAVTAADAGEGGDGVPVAVTVANNKTKDRQRRNIFKKHVEYKMFSSLLIISVSYYLIAHVDVLVCLFVCSQNISQTH